MKAIICAILLAACTSSHPVFPTQTENEKIWKQQYADGKITWSEYQSLLKAEKK